jgi:hypothetical protein
MADFGLTSTTYTVAEYCDMIGRNEIVVNREYQRSDKVWPGAAQSFLIETMLLGYPVPKLSLHQITDLKTRKTIKEIVDGQQRTKAIKAFFDGDLRLSRTLDLKEAAGRLYSELPDDLQQAFIDYPISVDLFTGASPDKIREVFRRINSYTVPLNPEEQRHATYQGEMKWFIYRLARDYDEVMLRIGTFTMAQLVRMADAKLYAEIIHALLHGITTTKKAELDTLYREKDTVFEEQNAFGQRFEATLDVILRFEDLHQGPLMKPHMMYSLILALMHVLDPVPSLTSLQPREREAMIDVTQSVVNLSVLAEALETDVPPDDYAAFVTASEQKTNVKSQREIRFKYLVQALVTQ